MNREEAKILAPIIAAFGEGKDITLAGLPLAEEISFDDSVELYEIKPEPEVIYVTKKNGYKPECYPTHEEARAAQGQWLVLDFEYIAKKFTASED